MAQIERHRVLIHILIWGMTWFLLILFFTEGWKDPLRLIHRGLPLIVSLLILIAINLIYLLTLFLIDPFSIIYAYLFPAAILWNTGSAINTLGHSVGYKKYQTNDMSQNNLILALLTWGEGFHNNHHRYPRSFYFGRSWYEIDISGLLINAILWTQKKSVINDEA